MPTYKPYNHNVGVKRIAKKHDRKATFKHNKNLVSGCRARRMEKRKNNKKGNK